MQNTSRVYGERLGCIVDKSHKLMECLRSRSFEELGNVRLNVRSNPVVPFLEKTSNMTCGFIFSSRMSVLGHGVRLLIEKFANQLIIGMKDGRKKIGLSSLIFQKN